MAVRPEHQGTIVLHPITNSYKHEVLLKGYRKLLQKELRGTSLCYSWKFLFSLELA